MPQMAIGRMRVACWIPKARDTHTLRMCNIYCFPTATMVMRTRLSVTFICTLIVSVKDKLLRKIFHVVMKCQICYLNREFRDLCRSPIIIIIIIIIEIIHFPYFAAVYLLFKRVLISVAKRFLFTFLPKSALLIIIIILSHLCRVFMYSIYVQYLCYLCYLPKTNIVS